jgi:hypothetical protein
MHVTKKTKKKKKNLTKIIKRTISFTKTFAMITKNLKPTTQYMLSQFLFFEILFVLNSKGSEQVYFRFSL